MTAATPQTPTGQTPRDAKARTTRRILVSAAALLVVTGLAACSNSSGSTSPARSTGHSSASSAGSASPSSTANTSAASTAVDITVDKAARDGMNPTTPVSVQATGGTLTSVVMTNQSGKKVTGQLSSGGTAWQTSEVLGYGKTYTVVAHGKGSDGASKTTTSKFTTMNPSSQNVVTMDRMGGYELDGDETYGVGIIPVVHFASAVSNEAAAQKTFSVKASRTVHGVWSWIDDQDAAYRPENYWPAHTKVTVSANVYGVDLGHDTYGASDEQVDFTVGRRQVTIADDNAPEGVDKVRIYNAAGKVLRTMDTSMGQHGGTTLPNGTYINFYTLNGTYTVLEHDNPAIMNSTSYGWPVADGGYGNITVPYSTKISVDGIYIHEYNSTAYDQTHGIDASEGCLNLVTDDAVWYYNHSLIGDPVVVHGKAKAPEIQPWQGGYWSIPWSTWVKNSA